MHHSTFNFKYTKSKISELPVEADPGRFGFTISILLASSASFEFVRRLLISFSSEADLITTPLFLIGKPEASTGLISIPIDAYLVLYEGSFNRNTPRTLVAILSQSLESFINWDNLSSKFIWLVIPKDGISYLFIPIFFINTKIHSFIVELSGLFDKETSPDLFCSGVPFSRLTV